MLRASWLQAYAEVCTAKFPTVKEQWEITASKSQLGLQSIYARGGPPTQDRLGFLWRSSHIDTPQSSLVDLTRKDNRTKSVLGRPYFSLDQTFIGDHMQLRRCCGSVQKEMVCLYFYESDPIRFARGCFPTPRVPWFIFIRQMELEQTNAPAARKLFLPIIRKRRLRCRLTVLTLFDHKRNLLHAPLILSGSTSE